MGIRIVLIKAEEKNKYDTEGCTSCQIVLWTCFFKLTYTYLISMFSLLDHFLTKVLGILFTTSDYKEEPST